MRKTRFIDTQITLALRQADSGVPVGEICRKIEIGETASYRWKKKLGGLGMAELRELRQVRDENHKPEQLEADMRPDRPILQESLGRQFQGRRGRSSGNGCAGLRRRIRCSSGGPGGDRSGSFPGAGLSPPPAEAGAPEKALKELAEVRVRYAYRRLNVLLRRQGWAVNPRRVYRLYPDKGPALPAQAAEAPAKRVGPSARPPVLEPNEHWAMNLMHDALASGKKLRVLTVVAINCSIAALRRGFIRWSSARKVCREQDRPHARRRNRGTGWLRHRG